MKNNISISKFKFMTKTFRFMFYLFMVANQRLIMIRIHFDYFFNILASKIHHKKRGEERVFKNFFFFKFLHTLPPHLILMFSFSFYSLYFLSILKHKFTLLRNNIYLVCMPELYYYIYVESIFIINFYFTCL